MSYKPLTRQQADEMSRPPLIDDGQYQFQLMEYNNVDKYNNRLVDRNGDEMTRIRIKVWDSNGKERFLFTNLMWGEVNRMSYRTRHFAESLGVVDMYESGKLYDCLAECIGRLGYCEIYTQAARSRNDGTDAMWPAKNEVRDFIVATQDSLQSSSAMKRLPDAKNEFDSELPF